MRRGAVAAPAAPIFRFSPARRLSLGILLADAAAKFGSREAFAPGLRYSEFLAAAHNVCDALKRAGIAVDEPVHVRISNHPLDLAAYAGVWLAGGVVVPVHRSAPAGATAHVLTKTRARFEWDALAGAPLRPLAERA
ncbi:MAG TPA: AMP-binding protein, partial [Burkholderiales bacterium]|nr:AMP-binding protein [Burkholderiales bacterium]